MELAANLPPTQFHHGQDDPVIPVSWMQKTADEMKAKGIHVNVNIYPDQPHTLDKKSGDACRQRTHEFLLGLLQCDEVK